MARGKKNEKEITTEERLEQALVPAEEQPYSVPENWCWTKIEHIASVKGGKRLPKGRQFSKNPTEHPYLRVTDFENRSIILEQIKYIDISTFCEIKNYTISAKDIYISIAGTIGKVGIIPTFLDGANLTENAAKITDIKGIDQKFLMWLLESEFAQRQIKESTISTTQPKLALFRIEKINILLPPLAEQQRIVDRIESLFAKLDEAKEKAQAVVDGFEARKAAILHKAFTGELTAQWRRLHKRSSDSWNKTSIGALSFLVTKGASPKWQGVNYTDDKSKTLFVTSENVRNGYLLFEKEKYLDNKINKIQSRSILQFGDILVNIVGASIGRAAIYDREQLANINQAVCIIRLKEGINKQFICLFLNSPLAQIYFSENKVETARANISLSDIKNMSINLPQIDEQLEIVSLLMELFSNEQKAKEAAEAILDQIEVMKKSILAHAFRGELGTNDPVEESGVELLKQVL